MGRKAELALKKKKKTFSASAPLKAELKLLGGGEGGDVCCLRWQQGSPLAALGGAQLWWLLPQTFHRAARGECWLRVCCLLSCFQVWPQVNDKLVKCNLDYSVFYKPDATSSHAVTPLWEESVGVQKWLCTDYLGACLRERENFSLLINCVQLNILYISYKRAFPFQNVSHWDLVRSSSYKPLLLFTLFHSWGLFFCLFLVWFWWWIEKHLEKATKTTVYRLKKNTAFILLGSWATILLQISSPLLCFKSVSNVDEGQKSLTLLCLHTEENVQCLFVFPIIFVLFTNFNCSRVAFIFCNHW